MAGRFPYCELDMRRRNDVEALWHQRRVVRSSEADAFRLNPRHYVLGRCCVVGLCSILHSAVRQVLCTFDHSMREMRHQHTEAVSSR